MSCSLQFSDLSRRSPTSLYRASAFACVLFAAASLPADPLTLGPTQELGAGITPGIAVDPAGAIHVVAMHDGAIWHRSTNAVGQFGGAAAVPVPEGPADYNSPHLVADARGALHLVFTRDATGASKRVWYARHAQTRWREPRLLIDHSGTGRRANYARLFLAPQADAAYVSAFTGGSFGSSVIRLENLSSAPRETARIDTPLWVAHALPTSSGDVHLLGRARAAGHKFQLHSADLQPRGEPQLISVGTPWKTFEATTAVIDDQGVIHVVGLTKTAEQAEDKNVLWYNNSTRAAAGQPAILGDLVGPRPSERVYPLMIRDARGRLYVSFTDQGTNEAKLTMIEPDGPRFAPSVTIAPAITSRLRWNAQLAPAPGGGVYLVWDHDRRVFFRAVGVGE